MHELAFTEGIIKIVTSEQEKQHFSKCLEITLSVGEFSGIVPDCVREFFPLASKGTAAEGAKITVIPNEDRFGCYVENLIVE